MLKGDAAPASGTASSGSRVSARGVLFVFSLVWLVASTALGLTQSLRPDPLTAPEFMTLDWWRYPVERNAALRLPLIGGTLRGLHVASDGEQLWVVGDAGLILHSIDAGASWSRQRLPGDTSAPEPGSERSAAKGAWLGVIGSANAAANAYDPKQQSAQQPIDSALQSKAPDKAQGGVVGPLLNESEIRLLGEPVSPNAAPRKNPKAGDAPTTVTPPPVQQQVAPAAVQSAPQRAAERPVVVLPPDLNTIAFDASGRRGLLGAADGTLFGTRDGGTNWEPLVKIGSAILAVALRPDGQQWMVSRSGALYLFEAASNSWRVRAELGALADAAIDAASGRVLMLTQGARIFDSVDGGASWREAAAPLGGRGRILQLRADGETWGGQRGVWLVRSAALPYALGAPVGTQVPDVALRAVRSGGGRMFAVGESGSIFRQLQGAAQWQALSAGAVGALREIRVTAGGAGSAVGAGGIRYTTLDGGLHWQPQGARYQRWPAPWLWVAWVVGLLGLAAAALRRPPPQSNAVTDTAADAFVSDKPLAAAREDRLDFAPLAWGLSAFLRNEKTDAPLTIAITGDWGSGKSSLMGLLKEDLSRFGVRCVWFNAWHHQKEEALLAALLTSIRDQAIPGWLSLEGFEYRVRLLWTRGRRYWPMSLAVAFSVGLFGWTLTHPGTVLDNWLTLANDLWFALSDDKVKPDPDSFVSRLRAMGLAAGAFAPLVGALLRMRAFGVDPASLAASISSRASVKDLGSQASFRQKFAEQFGEVTAALEPRTMLVLIDDLDRCKPEAVLEVMEAVNFLVSSGRVYVVLGMARARVEACVGLAFEKVAHELVEAESAKAAAELPGEDKDARARRVRREYAQQYLEKLINIEVPVPRLDPTRSAHLQDEDRADATGFALPQAARRVCRLWPVLIGVCAIWAGAWLGSQLPAAVQRTPDLASAPVVKVVAGTPASAKPPAASVALPTEQPQGPVFFIAATTPQKAWGSAALLLLITTVMAGLGLVRRPSPVVRDSPAFRDALAIWNPVVATALRTPRAVKRYQNRVRYLAMMARNSRRAPTLRDELRMWLLRRHEALVPLASSDPSPELVAIGALDKAVAGWESAGSPAEVLARVESTELRDALKAAFDAHAKRFDLAAVRSFVPQFRRLATGVRMEAAPSTAPTGAPVAKM
ncbi:P-loop NTPase fold protein [Niveibacterium sp. COAC-50]|uniref:P-loop NTPase fold protein n=1 Tax=Niveibacterium sp. COAC-50 TaxID=2729384 RepID=UPI00155344CB|nr:P-loop NTPase fold protein [Niveibacterium sp. COAC-50]